MKMFGYIALSEFCYKLNKGTINNIFVFDYQNIQCV